MSNNLMYKSVNLINDLRQEIVEYIHNLSCFKIGEFTLKSGVKSPYYLDLRNLISSSSVINKICNYINTIEYISLEQYQRIGGVPYGAIPIATALSLFNKIPMVMIRKEAKKYGTKKLVEGIYKQNDSMLLIEDVITSGLSLLETIDKIESEGIRIGMIIVLVDRQSGGLELLRSKGYNIRALFTVTDIIKILYSRNLISNKTLLYIDGFDYSQSKQNDQSTQIKQSKQSNQIERAIPLLELSESPIKRRLVDIMNKKKSNLCFAADFTKSSELLSYAEKIGPYICILKTHIDILEDFTSDVVIELKRLSRKHNFLLFEDRKFGDIGKTFERQLYGGMYKIGEWADIVNIHGISADGMLQYLEKRNNNQTKMSQNNHNKHNEPAILIVSEMSSNGNLITSDYTQRTLEIARKYSNQVLGFITQIAFGEQQDKQHFMYMTPGVKILTESESNADVDQRYRTPKQAIQRDNCDIIIVGSGIYSHKNPIEIAKKYIIRSWK